MTADVRLRCQSCAEKKNNFKAEDASDVKEDAGYVETNADDVEEDASDVAEDDYGGQQYGRETLMNLMTFTQFTEIDLKILY